MMGLDNIVGHEEKVMQQKQKMYDDLLLKYDNLSNPKKVLISYSTDLDYDYQRNIAEKMLFNLWMDLNRKSTAYKKDDDFNTQWKMK